MMLNGSSNPTGSQSPEALWAGWMENVKGKPELVENDPESGLPRFTENGSPEILQQETRQQDESLTPSQPEPESAGKEVKSPEADQNEAVVTLSSDTETDISRDSPRIKHRRVSEGGLGIRELAGDAREHSQDPQLANSAEILVGGFLLDIAVSIGREQEVTSVHMEADQEARGLFSPPVKDKSPVIETRAKSQDPDAPTPFALPNASLRRTTRKRKARVRHKSPDEPIQNLTRSAAPPHIRFGGETPEADLPKPRWGSFRKGNKLAEKAVKQSFEAAAKRLQAIDHLVETMRRYPSFLKWIEGEEEKVRSKQEKLNQEAEQKAREEAENLEKEVDAHLAEEVKKNPDITEAQLENTRAFVRLLILQKRKAEQEAIKRQHAKQVEDALDFQRRFISLPQQQQLQVVQRIAAQQKQLAQQRMAQQQLAQRQSAQAAQRPLLAPLAPQQSAAMSDLVQALTRPPQGAPQIVHSRPPKGMTPATPEALQHIIRGGWLSNTQAHAARIYHGVPQNQLNRPRIPSLQQSASSLYPSATNSQAQRPLLAPLPQPQTGAALSRPQLPLMQQTLRPMTQLNSVRPNMQSQQSTTLASLTPHNQNLLQQTLLQNATQGLYARPIQNQTQLRPHGGAQLQGLSHLARQQTGLQGHGFFNSLRPTLRPSQQSMLPVPSTSPLQISPQSQAQARSEILSQLKTFAQNQGMLRLQAPTSQIQGGSQIQSQSQSPIPNQNQAIGGSQMLGDAQAASQSQNDATIQQNAPSSSPFGQAAIAPMGQSQPVSDSMETSTWMQQGYSSDKHIESVLEKFRPSK